jgi:hypothetical protein
LKIFKYILLINLFAYTTNCIANDSIPKRTGHLFDFGIVGRTYGHGLHYELWDEGFIQKLGINYAETYVPCQPHFAFFYHRSFKKNTISLGWMYFREDVGPYVIQFTGYQLGYAYKIIDHKGWLTLSPKIVLPIGYGTGLLTYRNIRTDLGLGCDILMIHRSGITLRNEFTMQYDFGRKLPYFQHQLCIGYKF